MRLVSTLTRPTAWWIGVSVWFVVLFILSSQANFAPPSVTFTDKILHFIYFAGGGTAFFLGFRLQKPPYPLPVIVLLTAVFAGLVGWFDEWHQTHTIGRSGNDLGDWIADITGGTFGCAIGAFLFHSIKKRAKDGTKSQMISSNR